MKTGGIGGAKTLTGLNFEDKVDFQKLLGDKPGYKIEKLPKKAGMGVFFNNELVARCFRKHEFYKFLDESGIDWKKIGLEIGKNFGFEPYFPKLRYFVVDDPVKVFNLSQELYPLILRQILIFFGDKKFEIDPPIIQKEMNNIIFRIRGSKYCRSKIFFHLLSGIEEAEIGQIIPFPIKIDVLQQISEKKIVDINFKIFPDEKRETIIDSP